eukprot:TRINITY_DN66919_c2_g1_i1.p1 TRINITY_DN66919_c2_g1~~TRINITY_DN66919_c2_g1_i1.p1  ORF type:complete len:130 (+),score=2.98 TRINITY_DN66919_c2_g1_i1:61-450(+)
MSTLPNKKTDPVAATQETDGNQARVRVVWAGAAVGGGVTPTALRQRIASHLFQWCAWVPGEALVDTYIAVVNQVGVPNVAHFNLTYANLRAFVHAISAMHVDSHLNGNACGTVIYDFGRADPLILNLDF